MMQDFEYDRYASQLEETCKKIAPQRRVRVWRFAEASQRLPKPGTLEAQGKVHCPMYMIVELSLTVDGVEHTHITEAPTMQWATWPVFHNEIAEACLRYIIGEIARKLLG